MSIPTAHTEDVCIIVDLKRMSSGESSTHDYTIDIQPVAPLVMDQLFVIVQAFRQATPRTAANAGLQHLHRGHRAALEQHD